MVQGGRVLLDTCIVHTVTVPALAVLIGKANWWPSGRMGKRAVTP